MQVSTGLCYRSLSRNLDNRNTYSSLAIRLCTIRPLPLVVPNDNLRFRVS